MGCVLKNKKKQELDQKVQTTIDTLQIKAVSFDHACGYNFCCDAKDIQLCRRKAHINVQLNKINFLKAIILIVEEHYEQHRIDQCYSYLDKLQQMIKSIDFQCIKQQIQFKPPFALIAKITKQYKDLQYFQKQIQREGWVFQNVSSDVTISSREEQAVSVLMQTTIQVPIQYFFQVITDIELYSQFIPFTKFSRLQKIIARNIRIGYAQISFPLLSIREACFQGMGYNRIKHKNCLFLFCRSLYNQDSLCIQLNYIPVKHENFVQMNFNYLIIKYEPINLMKGKVTMITNLDMKINFIPMGLMNYICCKFGEDLLKRAVQICNDFENSIWDKNAKKNPQLMNFFQKVIQREYLSKQKSAANSNNMLIQTNFQTKKQ